MPFYNCIAREGLLSDAEKAAIAAGITDIHCSLTGAPRQFVHVVFDSYAPTNAYSGGQPSNFSFIRAGIRAGRTPELKLELLQALTELWRRECHNGSVDQLLVTLTETPGANVMEAGILLPHPKDDMAWMEAHGLA